MKISDSQQFPLSHTLRSDLPAPVVGPTPPQGEAIKAQNPEEMREAAKQYEAFFISYLMKVMRETVHESSWAGKGGEYFYSFYDQEIGTRAAQAGGIGISRMVEDYIEKNFPAPPQVPAGDADTGSDGVQQLRRR